MALRSATFVSRAARLDPTSSSGNRSASSARPGANSATVGSRSIGSATLPSSHREARSTSLRRRRMRSVWVAALSWPAHAMI